VERGTFFLGGMVANLKTGGVLSLTLDFKPETWNIFLIQPIFM
jgi:hypothetical protein